MKTKTIINGLLLLTATGTTVAATVGYTTMVAIRESGRRLVTTESRDILLPQPEEVGSLIEPDGPIVVLPPAQLLIKITRAEQQAVISLIQETVATLEVEYDRRNEVMVANSETLIQLAICESTLGEKVVSDNGLWYGLYQWRDGDIPGGRDCALDGSCATIATVDAIQGGEAWRWPTCRSVVGI